MINLKNYIIEVDYFTKIDDHKEMILSNLIKENHYSKKIAVNTTYWFTLKDLDDKVIGAMQVGLPNTKNAENKYAPGGKLLELKRLACIENTPKNTESFFIGAVMRWLIKNTKVTHILSYADSNQGHVGTIYKASNFTYLGQTPQASNCVVLHNGVQIPTRTAYNKKLPIYKEIQEGRKSGTTKNIYLKPKHIYLYNLENRR